MSNHTGYITFTLSHSDKKVTATGSVTHKAANFPDAKLSFKDIPVGFVTPKLEFGTETTSIDHWELDVTLSNKKRYTCHKDCAFYSEDSGGIVATSLVVASNESGTFNVNPPESGNCSENC